MRCLAELRASRAPGVEREAEARRGVELGLQPPEEEVGTDTLWHPSASARSPRALGYGLQVDQKRGRISKFSTKATGGWCTVPMVDDSSVASGSYPYVLCVTSPLADASAAVVQDHPGILCGPAPGKTPCANNCPSTSQLPLYKEPGILGLWF